MVKAFLYCQHQAIQEHKKHKKRKSEEYKYFIKYSSQALYIFIREVFHSAPCPPPFLLPFSTPFSSYMMYPDLPCHPGLVQGWLSSLRCIFQKTVRNCDQVSDNYETVSGISLSMAVRKSFNYRVVLILKNILSPRYINI